MGINRLDVLFGKTNHSESNQTVPDLPGSQLESVLPSGRAGRGLADDAGSVLDLGQIRVNIEQIHHDGIVGPGFQDKGIDCASREEKNGQ
jgi:hypothetical protein